MEDIMLIPVLHFNGDCTDAIHLYENAFSTEARNYEYSDDKKIRHAEMTIHGEKVFFNDGYDFIRNTYGVDCAAHLILTFKTSEELLACYDQLKKENDLLAPFIETPYSKLVGNFIDKFGVLWGFMVVE